MLKHTFTFIFLFALSSFAAIHVAVLETFSENGVLGRSEKLFLTDRLRERAKVVLPSHMGYIIMTRENIQQMLPPGKSIEDCEGTCLVETGKNISADYVAQARVGKFGQNLSITVELYETTGNNLVGSYTAVKKDIEGLLDEISNKSDNLFKLVMGNEFVQPYSNEKNAERNNNENFFHNRDYAKNANAAPQFWESKKIKTGSSVKAPVEYECVDYLGSYRVVFKGTTDIAYRVDNKSYRSSEACRTSLNNIMNGRGQAAEYECVDYLGSYRVVFKGTTDIAYRVDNKSYRSSEACRMSLNNIMNGRGQAAEYECVDYLGSYRVVFRGTTDIAYRVDNKNYRSSEACRISLNNIMNGRDQAAEYECVDYLGSYRVVFKGTTDIAYRVDNKSYRSYDDCNRALKGISK